MLLIRRITAPFVTYVHLLLPAPARQSKEQLARYCNALPQAAAVNITLMNFLGLPRVSRVPIDQLFIVSPKGLNLANFARDTRLIDAKKPWWAPRPVKEFSIQDGKGNAREGWVWDIVTKKIKQNTALR